MKQQPIVCEDTTHDGVSPESACIWDWHISNLCCMFVSKRLPAVYKGSDLLLAWPFCLYQGVEFWLCFKLSSFEHHKALCGCGCQQLQP